MNEQRIEELLRKAPAKTPPGGLVARMKKDIRLPRAEKDGSTMLDPRIWLRRWLPALSMAVFLIACAGAVGIQANLISELKRNNEKLRAAAQNLGQLRADNADYERLLARSQELDRLRQANADLPRLREEAARLQAQVLELEKSRAGQPGPQTGDGERRMQPAGGPREQDKTSSTNEEADSCLKNLNKIGIAALTWAKNHDGLYPTNFISMSDELGDWKLLQCPGDMTRKVTDWHDVETGNISYEILALPPGLTQKQMADLPGLYDLVFVRCPIHGSVLIAGGSAYLGGSKPEPRLMLWHGKTFLVK